MKTIEKLHYAHADGYFGEAYRVSDTQFLKEITTVRFDGFVADTKLAGDLVGRVFAGYEPEDFHFPFT